MICDVHVILSKGADVQLVSPMDYIFGTKFEYKPTRIENLIIFRTFIQWTAIHFDKKEVPTGLILLHKILIWLQSVFRKSIEKRLRNH